MISSSAVLSDPAPVSVDAEAKQRPSPPRALRQQIFNAPLCGRSERRGAMIDEFLAATDRAEKLRIWLGRAPRSPVDWQQAKRLLGRDLAAIDQILEEQLNAVLHHPRFQQLESAWRGLRLLTEQAAEAAENIERDGERGEVQIRVLNVSQRALFKDFDKAVEFDQSTLFQRVYEDEFGIAGGEPFGLLIGDYEFTNHPDDVDLLSNLCGVAAAAFAPIVTSASPQLFGLDDLASLEQPLNLAATFEQVEYGKWQALRERDDSRFLGLTVPRILMRPPYVDDGSQRVGFRFREQVEGPDRSRYLWGTSAWAFASTVIRAYADCGWFADIRGAQRGVEGGGLVTNLATHSFATDPDGVALKSSTEVAINEVQEKQLSELGFIPLCDSKDTPFSVFYANQSVHRPRTYEDPVATANARVSAMLQYVLCASRFAHYLKILARQKVGSMQQAEQIQKWLNEWLTTYVTPDEKASPNQKARFPLRAGETSVNEIPGRPGQFSIKMHLLPHYQLDELTATVRLVARVATPRTE